MVDGLYNVETPNLGVSTTNTNTNTNTAKNGIRTNRIDNKNMIQIISTSNPIQLVCLKYKQIYAACLFGGLLTLVG